MQVRPLRSRDVRRRPVRGDGDGGRLCGSGACNSEGGDVEAGGHVLHADAQARRCTCPPPRARRPRSSAPQTGPSVCCSGSVAPARAPPPRGPLPPPSGSSPLTPELHHSGMDWDREGKEEEERRRRERMPGSHLSYKKEKIDTYMWAPLVIIKEVEHESESQKVSACPYSTKWGYIDILFCGLLNYRLVHSDANFSCLPHAVAAHVLEW